VDFFRRRKRGKAAFPRISLREWAHIRVGRRLFFNSLLNWLSARSKRVTLHREEILHMRIRSIVSHLAALTGRTAAIVVGCLVAVGMAGVLAAQEGAADEPLQPLRVGGDAQGGTAEARQATIGGLEVYSLPPGKSLVLRFENRDDLSGFEELFVKINDEPYRRVPEQLVRLRGDGVYHIVYYGTDRAGNKSAPRNRHVMLDSTAPLVKSQLSDSILTAGGAVGPRARLSLMAQDSGTGVDRVQWRPGRDGEWRDYTAPIALRDLAGDAQQKQGIVEYIARDRVGNETVSTIFTYMIDTTAPALPPLFNDSASEPILVTRDSMRVPAYEKDAIFTYSLDGGNYAPVSPGERIVLPESGEHTLSVRIADELGNAREKTYRILVDLKAPVTEIRVAQ
jgi:hypothetical protein